MENATQALFMAAGVLIAVIIISLSVFLFSSASRVSENYDITMSEVEISKYNSQFSKYNTSNSTNKGTMLENTSYNVASDIVSAINLAYSLNEDYNYDIQRGVQVVIKGVDSNLKPTGNEENQMGITPLVQAYFKDKKINDKNYFYRLINNKKKSEYTNNSSYGNADLKHVNQILEKFSDCTYYKENDKYYKIYKYYFKGSVNINSESGLVDEVVFTCIDNSKNYGIAFNQDKLDT